MNEQQRVAEFIEEYHLEAPPEFRLLDLVSELGEVAKNATESTNYGERPKQLDIEADEIGDVLFSLLAVAESLDINASKAIDQSLIKYGKRIKEKDNPSSGE